MLSVSLGDWELGNSGSWEEPFLPATVLRRLKTARGLSGETGYCRWPARSRPALALEMTEDALRDVSTYARR